MAVDIVINSKMRRTGICGALETLLVDKEISNQVIPIFVQELTKVGCHLKGDEETIKIDNSIELALETDWTTEYLEAILSIKIVDGVIGAINHINKYGTMHTDAIITKNKKTAQQFLKNVKSSIAMHNTSTQFADGGEFGFGGEVGISTNTLPPRGPVGLEQLVSYKYEISSKGKIRD